MTDRDDPKVSHSFRRVDGHVQLETRVQDKVLRAVVDYALGSSDRYLSMVGHDEQARVRVLRLSYHQGADGTGWIRTKDQPPHPEAVGEFLGKTFDQLDGANECLKCHTTVGRSVRNRTGPSRPTTRSAAKAATVLAAFISRRSRLIARTWQSPAPRVPRGRSQPFMRSLPQSALDRDALVAQGSGMGSFSRIDTPCEPVLHRERRSARLCDVS